MRSLPYDCGKKGLFLLALLSQVILDLAAQQTIYREAQDTLTAVELDHGDRLEFKLRNGEVRTLTLLETDSQVLLTNLQELKKPIRGAGTIYNFTCKVLVDGQPMVMERYVCTQESFYEPYVINAMRIWFDGAQDIFENINESHGPCRPGKHARFAIADASDRICPDPVSVWYPNDGNFIDIRDTYNGDDVYMGPYFGADAHGGLDINQKKGTPNFAPIGFDDHFLFHSLGSGSNNNRWRGLRSWANGDVWVLQNHHVLNLLIPEHQALSGGQHYLAAAGVRVGAHHHSHYFFRVENEERGESVILDPWIIFWQAFEDRKEAAKELRAVIRPFGPGKAGEEIRFDGSQSRPGPNRSDLRYRWTFGDGGFSDLAKPRHRYRGPGVYPVTLVVDDGSRLASSTHHITIEGAAAKTTDLRLFTEDDVSFFPRKVQEMDVYGRPPPRTPHTLNFVARSTRPKPDAKYIQLLNTGDGVLSPARCEIRYEGGEGWLSLQLEGSGNEQRLGAQVDGTGLGAGRYRARVEVTCSEAINASQVFLVELTVPSVPAGHRVFIDFDGVDNEDADFYASSYFWVGARFHAWSKKGYRDFYVSNGGRAEAGEFVRFTPDLAEGNYMVSFAEETPFDPADRVGINFHVNTQHVNPDKPLVNAELNPPSRFAVRIKHAEGMDTVWVEPAKSLEIGTYRFKEGMDGYVELLAEGSTGQVIADAIRFQPLK